MTDHANIPTAPDTTSLLESLTQLRALVSGGGNGKAFGVDEGGACHERFLELRRLERSLNQYLSRTGQQLTYVGLLGHFSAGKSSTINALLEGAGERATGQHPTDRAVTLITHPQNAQDLIGMHRRGEVEVGAALQEHDLLRDVVLVDTPGSGDPLIVEEMVRDFLPICDHLVYVFSAAVPLDTTDLPILQKAHSELPFIPMQFVVTRADEFRKDHLAPLTDSNFDHQAADHFVGEFISRLEAAVPGMEAQRSDFIIIDNRSAFRLERLRHGLGAIKVTPGKSRILHAHKLRYFAKSASLIHQQFIEQLQGTLGAQEALLKAAKENHARYQKTVAMGHSRLTESWRLQLQQFETLQSSYRDEMVSLAFRQPIPEKLADLPKSSAAISAAMDVARASAAETAGVLSSQIEVCRRKEFETTRCQLIEEITNVADPEVVTLTMARPGGVLEDEASIQQYFVPSGELEATLQSLPTVFASELTRLHKEAAGKSEALGRWLEPGKLCEVSTELLDTSKQQLAAMLDTFLESVDVYKAAVLSLNARELAERAGVVRAIEALEKVEIPAERRDTWLRNVVERIFPDRAIQEKAAQSGIAELRDALAFIQKNFTTCDIAPAAGDSSTDSTAAEASIGELREVAQSAALTFQQRAHKVFHAVGESKDASLAGDQKTLEETVARLREDRKRISRTFAISGAVAGLILFILASLVLPIFQSFSVTSAGIGIVLIGAGVFGGTQLADKFDRSRAALKDCCNDYRERARATLLEALADVECPDSEPTSAHKAEISNILQAHWRSQVNQIVAASVDQHHSEYEKLRATREEMDRIRKDALTLGQKFYQHNASCYKDVDGNLDQLAAVSAEIKEDAILPSFRLFEDRTEELSNLLAAVRSIHFEVPTASANAPASAATAAAR
ncbi:MAG: GTPase [Verrucomicrobiales bacterium]